MKKLVKIILLSICLLVFIFAAYKIYLYLSETNENKELNKELIDKVIFKVSDDVEEGQDRNTMPIIVDFFALKQKNKDIVGWIYSDDTPINYPIVQSKDNEYYLRRLINGNYNTAGSIFMDYRSNSNFDGNHTILYGHNMKNGTMFGTLQKYKKQDYYDEHKVMYLATIEQNYVIELFFGGTVSVDSDIYNLSRINQNKVDALIKRSDFRSDVVVMGEDKIISLSTCAYEYEGARYVVMGALRPIGDR